ncbi:MAG: ABC transporter permease [Anaerotruncus sp.]|nr:ABC transporter permease [Anaerotruncus sp.]
MIALISKYAPLLWEGVLDTLYMTAISTFFAYLLGLPMGVLLKVTDRGGIMENRAFNWAFGWLINILRSFPFAVLMIALFPLTRLIVGKSIGPTAACVPLVVSAAPFVARLVESSLAEVDNSVVEAAKCMGATNWQIITRVMLIEAVPSLVRGLSISVITLVGYSAMAGTIGAGGLGDIAIRYGQHRYRYDVMMITVALLVVLVCLIQVIFDKVASGIDKRNR